MPYIANPLEGLPIRNSFITDQSLLGAAAALDDTIILYDISATALKQLTIGNMQAGILASPTFTGTPTAPTQSAGNDTTRLATTAFVTAATTALNTVTEMTDVTITSIQADEVLKWNGSAWINQTLAQANILPASNPTFTGTLTVGSATIVEADLELIDGLTAGTVVVSKAITASSNKDVATIRNLTIDGVFTDGNYSFDTSGNVTGLGTIASGAITSTGVITGTGFTVGNAVIAEAELEMLDGITAGTAAASKALVLDSNTNVTGIGTISSGAITSSGVITGTGFTIGSAVIIEAELEMIDGITAGTAAASKALVLDSSTNITGIGTISSAAITSSGVVTGTGFTIGSAAIIESELEMIDGITAGTAAASKALVLDSSTNITGIGTVASGTHTIGSLVVAAASITDTSGSISFGDDNITTSGTVSAGNLTVTGTTTTVNSTVMTVVDPIIHLQTASGGGALGSDTNKDVGLAMQYHNGSAAKTAFLGFDDSAGKLTFIPDATIESEVITSGSVGTLVANLEGTVTATGTINMSTQDIDNIRSATFIDEIDNEDSGTSDTIDWGAGQKQKSRLTGNCTFTFTAPDGPCNLMLKCTNDGTARTITWPATVKWPASTAPTFTGTNNVRDVIAFYYDGTHYFGAISLAFPA